MSALFDAPIHTNAQNLERVLAAGRPALLVFETPQCGPCRTLAPALDELARAFAGQALIVRIDDARAGDLAARYRVTRVPTLILWRDGRELARVEGAAPASALRDHLSFLTGKGPRPATAGGPSEALPGAPSAAPPPGARTAGPAREAASGAGAGTTGGDGRPLVVSDADFEQAVLRSPLPALVDFWAPWCGPCRMVSPLVEAAAGAYAGRLRVAKLNTDENPRTAGRYNVTGIPTLIFYRDGYEVDRLVGAHDRATIDAAIQRLLARS